MAGAGVQLNMAAKSAAELMVYCLDSPMLAKVPPNQAGEKAASPVSGEIVIVVDGQTSSFASLSF